MKFPTISGNIAYRFFESNELNFEIHIKPTKWKGGESQNSYSIESHDDEELNTLNNLFSSKISKEHFEQSTNGQGNEKRRILTIHSSALACLLLFHSISIDNPLEIPGINASFTRAIFEFTNTCVEEEHPSSIDVALFDDNKKIVLLLECKFSEYLHNGKADEISPKYLPYYNKRGGNKLLPKGLIFNGLKEGTDKIGIDAANGRCHHYALGIKQMISHFIGAENCKCKDEGYSIYLGSIVFDFENCGLHLKNPIFKKAIDDYTKLYRNLAENLNNLQSQIKVLPKLLTYQEVFAIDNKYNVPERIRQFYHL